MTRRDRWLVVLGLLLFAAALHGDVNISGVMHVINDAASNIIGKVGIDQTTPGTTNAVEPIPDTAAAVALTQKAVTANTATSVKASAGNVYGVSCWNPNSTVCYLQFYNTSGTPTCGTSVIWSLAIGNSAALNNVTDIPLQNHATGIATCAGTTQTGSTACTTAVSCTVFYK